VLAAIRGGKKAHRPCWGAAWIDFVNYPYGPEPVIRIIHVNRSMVWRPTQEDILAADWVVLSDDDSHSIDLLVGLSPG
jgi:hypothetical protein